ncbi:hypothetical protein A6F68_01270 [Tsuneonella dongtanensis]|uniref:Uncharacterized protein n=1 Tax=Tsuneonella dongtanensis TaxID=692370 RepID=A0A1B2ACC3_9SPHN|nr:hypothetical protein [Tsuneonella dongtanensis]ANY19787.1 hypothetical protein A6F68_01270 [Tsuneonella dongtanensis]
MHLNILSQKYELTQESSFWALLDVAMRWPEKLHNLTPFQKFALDRPGFFEESRVGRFLDDVERGSPTVMVGPDDLTR